MALNRPKDAVLAQELGCNENAIQHRRSRLREEQRASVRTKAKLLAQDFLRKTGRLD